MNNAKFRKIAVLHWNVNTCVGCGGQYAYMMIRKLTCRGMTPERPMEVVEQPKIRNVDQYPCPTCGLYQPDMLASKRKWLHRWILLAAPIAGGGIAGLYLLDLIQADWALLAAMAQVTVLGLFGFLVDLRNRNRNLPANRRKAEQKIAAGRLRPLQPGMSLMPGFESSPPRIGGALAMAAVAVALLALALPELVRKHATWPLNSHWYPPVVGPGDETCYYLPESIESVGGYWTGESRVTVELAGQPRSDRLEIASFTNAVGWGQMIEADNGARDCKWLWVRMTVPSDEKYAGKTVLCKVALVVEYPALFDGGHFTNVTHDFRHEVTLKLASPQAGREYRVWWWSGLAAGQFLLIVSILLRLAVAETLRKRANPTVFVDPQLV